MPASPGSWSCTGKLWEDLVGESGIEPTATVDSIAEVPELSRSQEDPDFSYGQEH